MIFISWCQKPPRPINCLETILAPFGQILAFSSFHSCPWWLAGSKNGISAWITCFLFFFSFLQDSLDLSHDEIHRSLQANMAANQSNGHAVDLNPMEFIEQNGGKIFSSKFFKTPFLGVWAFGFSLNTYENWTSFFCLPFIVKLIGVANWLLGFDEKKQ